MILSQQNSFICGVTQLKETKIQPRSPGSASFSVTLYPHWFVGLEQHLPTLASSLP